MKTLLMAAPGTREEAGSRIWAREWDKFRDICWDALQALRQEESRIQESWKNAVSTLKLRDPKFNSDAPTFSMLRHRLLISRHEFDGLMDKGTSSAYWKNVAHSMGQRMK